MNYVFFSRTEIPTKYTKYLKKHFIFPKEKRKTIRQKSYLWKALKDLTQIESGGVWRKERTSFYTWESMGMGEVITYDRNPLNVWLLNGQVNKKKRLNDLRISFTEPDGGFKEVKGGGAAGTVWRKVTSWVSSCNCYHFKAKPPPLSWPWKVQWCAYFLTFGIKPVPSI